MFAHLCVYESLYCLKINAFENWLAMKGKYQIFRSYLRTEQRKYGECFESSSGDAESNM